MRLLNMVMMALSVIAILCVLFVALDYMAAYREGLNRITEKTRRLNDPEDEEEEK
jgi:ammonia channel protein AmtB